MSPQSTAARLRAFELRRTTLAELERVLGEGARADMVLLSNHIADADPDSEMVAELSANISADPVPSRCLTALFERGHANLAAIAVLRKVLATLDISHPLTDSTRSTLEVETAFDLRRLDGLLRFHAKAGTTMRPMLPVVLVDLQQPLTGWRICVVESVFPIAHGSVVYLRRLMENNTPINDRPLEPSAVAVALSGEVAELVEHASRGRSQQIDVLKDAEFRRGIGGKNSHWTLHLSRDATPIIKTGPVLSLAGSSRQPTIAALHQLLKSHPPSGGYHFGIRWRCVSGSAAMAIRVMALLPSGEIIVDQFSMMLTPDDGWVTIDRTVLSDVQADIRFEVGVLDLTSDATVELTAPFIETFDGLWRSSSQEVI
ncbi:hypothetical protein [Brevundimonas subvibrioides]|uniref:hypothetical protein n=1 Tax=Brevundimonas subvibrioides TaxID=74313 RepID=UPI0032D5883B